MTEDARFDAAIEYARKAGHNAGENAAAWYVQDTIGGRMTGDPRKAAAYILRGIADGDSAVTDGFPFADLSGEWADTLTGPQLVADALDSTGAPWDGGTAREEWASDICDAYETVFSDAAQDAIETAARAILAD